MDIRPPRPKTPPTKPLPPSLPEVTVVKSPEPSQPRKRSKTLIVLGSIVAIIILAIASVVGWYFWALQPRTSGSGALESRIVVNSGDGANTIARKLEDGGLIRSARAMVLYTELTHTKSKLQAGGYRLSSAQSIPDIVTHLTSGKTDEFMVTILPGMTLDEISELLEKDGYSELDINTALSKHYDQPLLADKPEKANLEGYLYPDTYEVSAFDSLDVLFNKIFTGFYAKLKADGSLTAFHKHHLSIYQALTLASIVQKETGDEADQAQVAQVFYRRLSLGAPLGSDVTFIYAAKQLGVEASPSLDSPYNTRIHKGLPPGPIGNMGATALRAVAHPASGKYNYFVAGDDGKTYFAHTLDEHNANIAKYCQVLCSQ